MVGSRRMGEARGRRRLAGARRRDHGLHAAHQPARRDRGQRHRQRLPRDPGLAAGRDRLHRGPVPQPGAAAGRGAGRPPRRRRPGHHPPPDGGRHQEGHERALRARVPAGDAQDLAALTSAGLETDARTPKVPVAPIPFHLPAVPDVEAFFEDARAILGSGRSERGALRAISSSSASRRGSAIAPVVAVSNCLGWPDRRPVGAGQSPAARSSRASRSSPRGRLSSGQGWCRLWPTPP